jgi:peptidoglycan hydrolase-like protein with peptidoglycan-binding domain
VLALAAPSSALAATGTGGERLAAPTATPSAGQPRGAMLALGSGYESSQGSSAVRVLQRRMALAGDSPGPIDGRYGPLTRAAVMRFQAEHGLVVDGIVGPQTWGLTRSLVVSRGLGGQGGSEPVRALQRRLAAVGFAPGPIDGRYGLLTQHAVRRFQAAHGLQVDGIVGPATRAPLVAAARLVDQGSRHGSQPPVRAVHRTAPAHQTPATDRIPARHEVPATHHSPAVRPSGAPSTANNPSSTTSTGLLLVFGVVGLALTLIVARYAIKRTYRLESPPSPAGVRPSRSQRRSIGGSATAKTAASGSATAGTAATGSATTPPSPAAGARKLSAPPAPVPTAGSNGSHGHANDDHYANNGHPAENGNRTGGGSRGAAIGALASQARDPAADRRLGQRFEEHGDVNGAVAAYRRADERGDAAAAFHLAALLGQRGARAEAEAAYRRADQRGHGGAASNLGVMLEEQGAAAEAGAAYRRADTRGDAAAAFNLGALLEERGALPEAHDAYRRAEGRDGGEIAEISRRALVELAARQRTFAA